MQFQKYHYTYTRESLNQRITVTIDLPESQIRHYFGLQASYPNKNQAYIDSPARQWLANTVFPQVKHAILVMSRDQDMDIGSGVTANELGLSSDDFEHDPEHDINFVQFQCIQQGDETIRMEHFLSSRTKFRRNQHRKVTKQYTKASQPNPEIERVEREWFEGRDIAMEVQEEPIWFDQVPIYSQRPPSPEVEIPIFIDEEEPDHTYETLEEQTIREALAFDPNNPFE